MVNMYPRVLNNSTGAVDCTGGGKQPELVIVQYRMNVDVTLLKSIIVQGLFKGRKKCNKKRVRN